MKVKEELGTATQDYAREMEEMLAVSRAYMQAEVQKLRNEVDNSMRNHQMQQDEAMQAIQDDVTEAKAEMTHLMAAREMTLSTVAEATTSLSRRLATISFVPEVVSTSLMSARALSCWVER